MSAVDNYLENVQGKNPADFGFPHISQRDVNWPTVEHYDDQHGQHTAQLAVHILRTLVPVADKKAISAVWVAALLHDTGRTAHHFRPDPRHNERSRAEALRVLRADPNLWWEHELVERIAALISNHDTGRPFHRIVDPLEMALHDADCFEVARFFTPEMWKTFKEGNATDDGRTWARLKAKRLGNLCTPWARHPEHFATWLRYRSPPPATLAA